MKLKIKILMKYDELARNGHILAFLVRVNPKLTKKEQIVAAKKLIFGTLCMIAVTAAAGIAYGVYCK